MLKKYLEVGQIVSTHGIKGEVRLNPWSDSPDFLNNFKYLYFSPDEKSKVRLLASRSHGNISILKLEGIDSVEQAAALRNQILFMNRADVLLPEGSYFVQDLVGCYVFDADNGREYGTLSEVSVTGANDVWHIKSTDAKEYLIPVIPDVVILVDVENRRVEIRPLKGIFDDED